VLAYSTVSQLGYMFVAAGCGSYSAAIFHLGTHAFFKALLFLGAGAVIMAMHHEQDMEKMGGLRRRIPRTHWVFLIGTITIAGFPPFSGFFSKDEILVAAYASHVPGHQWLYSLGLVTAGITAFYMFRLHFRTFWGKSRVPHDVREHMVDPPNTVIFPLYALAAGAIVAGFVGLPQVWGDFMGVENSNSLHHFLAPVFPAAEPHHIDHSTEIWMAVRAVAVAAAGTFLAWWLYVHRPAWPQRIAEKASGLYRLLVAKYYVDEIYDATIVRPLVAVSDRVLFRGIDAGLIDGVAVNGMAHTVRAFAANGLKYIQSGFAQSYLLLMVVGAIAIVTYLLG
jgi:NADH-quinone oxidoreductase subunit L